MRYVLALLLLTAQTGGLAHAGRPCNVCATATPVITYGARTIAAAPVYNNVAAAHGNYLTYGQQLPVNYYVAPWLQAVAKDTYEFRGSQERLELERLRGYVARSQEVDKLMRAQLAAEGVVEEVTAAPAEHPAAFDGPQKPTQWAPQAGPGAPQTAAAAQPAQPAAAVPSPAARTLVQFHCSRCHGEATQSGGVWLDARAPLDGPDYDSLRGAAVRAIVEGRMPRGPDGKGVTLPSQTQFDLIREITGNPTQAQPAAGAPGV